MMDTKVSYARAMPTSEGPNLSLNVEKLRTKCKEMIFKAYRALGKPNGHDWVILVIGICSYWNYCAIVMFLPRP